MKGTTFFQGKLILLTRIPPRTAPAIGFTVATVVTPAAAALLDCPEPIF